MIVKPVKKESISINYLRGIAALAVALFHVRQFLWVGWENLKTNPNANNFDRICAVLSLPTPFGGAGVTLFFLISGFCIMLPYNSLSKKSFHLREYAARRFFRIYPLT